MLSMIHFMPVFLFRNFSIVHIKYETATNRSLDVTILRTFIAFEIAIYIFLKNDVYSPSHYVSSSTRITPNNKTTRDHSASYSYFTTISNCSFRIPHSTRSPLSIAAKRTREREREKETLKQYSVWTSNSLKYIHFFPFDRNFCLNFDSIWKLYVRAHKRQSQNVVCARVWIGQKKKKKQQRSERLIVWVNLTRDPYMNSNNFIDYFSSGKRRQREY